MKYLRLPLTFFSRRRPLAAACLFALSFTLLWMGFGVSELLPLPRVAVAESAPADHHNAPSDISPERAGLLQSSVDSVALGLGSALTAIAGEPARQAALGNALSALTFELGGEAYFTAWQGTRIMHSPLTPDTMGMDFADALDERGSAFVRTMENVADNGGGFVRVTLPRQLPRRLSGGFTSGGEAVSAPLLMNIDDAKVREGLDSLSASIVEKAADADKAARGRRLRSEPVIVRGSGIANLQAAGPADALTPDLTLAPYPALQDGRRGARILMDSTPVEQVVYIRRIPQSAWHIAAFMPAEPSPGFAGRGFSPAWSAATADKSALAAVEKDLRSGLCVSGFSLAGLAGLMVLPGRSREEEEQDNNANHKGSPEIAS